MQRRVLSAIAGISLVVGASGCSTARPAVPDDAVAFLAMPRGKSEEAVMVASADGSATIQVTSTSAGRSGLEWSPDGARLSFVWGYSGPFLVDADGGHLTSLERKFQATESSAEWSPDGTRVAFSTDDPKDGTTRNDLVVLDVRTGKLTPVSRDAKAPSWSPDGTRLAMRRCPPQGVGEPDACDVSVVGADGGASVEVATGIANGPVVWSADGSSVAFLRTVAGSADPGRVELVVARADGSRSSIVSEGVGEPAEFAWSDDGFSVAFLRAVAASDTVRHELVVARADGSGSSIVSDGVGEPTEFAWSSQGSQLAYIRRSAEDENAPTLEVVLTNADGTARRSVTDATWWNVFALNWSLDGRRLTFQVVTNSALAIHGYEIWTTDPATGATGRLVTDACGLRPSPDGTRIAYQAPCDELRGGVWVAAADGARPIRLAERASSPTWRPVAPT